MASTFLLLYAITNEKIIKLTQIDRIPAASRASQQKHVPIILVGIPYLSLIYLGCGDHKVEQFENIENIYCNSLSVQYNTIQCYLSTECIQNKFLFLKDCTSKHVGPIVSNKGF